MGTDGTNKTESEATEVESLSRFPWRVRVSAYNYINSDNHLDEPYLTLKEVGTVILSSSCLNNYDGIDLSGNYLTGSEGRTTWKLSDYICKPELQALDLPVSFVATPISEKPVYITVKFVALQTQPNNLVIEVYSWDAQGKPAPFTSFYYRCRIPLACPVILKRPPMDTIPDAC